ncbi:DUF4244 domain-containing protein [Nocardiopsis alba]|uniref:DUF4244 domain-containing protein n=1 Tax=Nocardiopsis alba TaxID=53437 RepID=UPI0005A77C7F|nr:DUF4244 domain-containing protein [Nocardiopsis alba]
MFPYQCSNDRTPLDDRGMTTAEYAMCTVAAVALAGILYLIVTGDPVQSALTSTIVDALGSDR